MIALEDIGIDNAVELAVVGKMTAYDRELAFVPQGHTFVFSLL